MRRINIFILSHSPPKNGDEVRIVCDQPIVVNTITLSGGGIFLLLAIELPLVHHEIYLFNGGFMKIIQAMVVSFAASFGVSASDANDWEALMPECFAIMEVHDYERDAYIATKLEEFPCNPQSLGEFLARIVCAKAADRILIEDSYFTRKLTAA
jgi:hypothetical protein